MSMCLTLAAWFVGLSVVMSLIEHQVHARLMHRRPKLFFLRNLASRKKIFSSHASEHHRQYRKSFRDDPVPRGEDRGIRLNIFEGLVESLPVSLLLALFSTTGALVFPVVVCLHHLLWNLIHMEMHKPEGRFFSKWPIFKSLARHHYLHHRYPDKNFNVALLAGDFLFGTMAKASDADWQAMKAEGLA
jgi:hypothetical protein